MRDHDHHAASRLDPGDRPSERLVTLGIQARVGLVQDDREWIAVEGARASAIRCLCPPDMAMPPSPTTVS